MKDGVLSLELGNAVWRLLNINIDDLYILQRLIRFVCLDILDRMNDLQPCNRPPKNHMLLVQPWRSRHSDKELTAICPGSCVCHAHHIWPVMLQIITELVFNSFPQMLLPPVPSPRGSPVWICLACPSLLPPNVDDSELLMTKCCERPICPRYLDMNPRLARYNPCLACLTAVGVIQASSSARIRSGRNPGCVGGQWTYPTDYSRKGSLTFDLPAFNLPALGLHALGPHMFDLSPYL